MTNRPKAIGTAAEMGVYKYLVARGKVDVYRPALQGINDLGDVHYKSDLGLVVISVKGGKMAERATPELWLGWLGEAEVQAKRAGTSTFYLVTKRVGVGDTRAHLWRAHYMTRAGRVWSSDLETMVDLYG